jgi:hypothetical protein
MLTFEALSQDNTHLLVFVKQRREAASAAIALRAAAFVGVLSFFARG